MAKTNVKTDVKEEVKATSQSAAAKKTDGRVDYIIPKYALGSDDVVEACVNGINYQIKCGVSVRIPKALAEVLDNAIAQKEKADNLIHGRNGKSVELDSNK